MNVTSKQNKTVNKYKIDVLFRIFKHYIIMLQSIFWLIGKCNSKIKFKKKRKKKKRKYDKPKKYHWIVLQQVRDFKRFEICIGKPEHQ